MLHFLCRIWKYYVSASSTVGEFVVRLRSYAVAVAAIRQRTARIRALVSPLASSDIPTSHTSVTHPSHIRHTSVTHPSQLSAKIRRHTLVPDNVTHLSHIWQFLSNTWKFLSNIWQTATFWQGIGKLGDSFVTFGRLGHISGSSCHIYVKYLTDSCHTGSVTS